MFAGYRDHPHALRQAKAKRDQRIAELADEGKTQTEIAKEAGVSQPTVNALYQKRKTSVSDNPPQPEEPSMPKINKRPAAERREQIADLANEGLRAHQIANKLGIVHRISTHPAPGRVVR